MNFEALLKNRYPGRSIVMGGDPSGEYVIQVYWIMARKEEHRNRVLVDRGDRIMTDVADTTKPRRDSSITIYNAMRERKGFYVVSNGEHTDTVLEQCMDDGFEFSHAMRHLEYEPDKPTHTSRIMAMYCHDPITALQPYFQIGIVRKSAHGAGCERNVYQYDSFPRGFGVCITTYKHDGDPPPTFCNDPYLLRIAYTDPYTIALQFWSALDEENRVALAVKSINVKSGESTFKIINKYKKV